LLLLEEELLDNTKIMLSRKTHSSIIIIYVYNFILIII